MAGRKGAGERMKKELRGVIIGVGLTLGVFAVAQSVQRTLNVFVNGQANADKAIVVNNTSYVPARVLRNFGVNVTAQGNNLLLSGVGGTAPVSSNSVSSNTGAAGTTQLSGTTGLLNTAYTVGKIAPVNFNLTSASYSLEPLSIRDDVYAANQDQKLLVLRFMVQNPAPRDLAVSWRTLSITAVDDKDVNHKFEAYWARTGEIADYSANLKPSQRVDLTTAWTVPANVRIVKLLIEGETNAPILRYDLTGKITPLPAPYSFDGFTALPEVAAQIGQSYILKNFSARVEQIAFSNAQIEGRTPEAGKRFLVATISLKNLSKNNGFRVDRNTILTGLFDADGGTRGNDNYLVRPSNGEFFEASEVRPGAEVRFNAYYEVDNSLGLNNFTLRESGEGRVFVYNISDLR